jgi:hypothetical protein
MRYSFPTVCLAVLADATLGFQSPNSLYSRPTSAPARPRAQLARRALVGGFDDSALSLDGGEIKQVLSETERWAAKVQTPSVQALRQMLIDQYLKLGRDYEYATREVDEFLEDPNRSKTWVQAQELQAEPGWGFGRVAGSANGPASQLPYLLAFFAAGALIKSASELLSS